VAESDTPYRIEDEADYCLIELRPELNKAPWGDIDRIGTALLERMQTRMKGNKHKAAFLVDLSPLNYMGSAMVALVVRLWKSTKDKNAQMVVVNRDENVLEVLQLSGLTQVWTIVETREEGFKALDISPKKPAPPEAAATTDQSSRETETSSTGNPTAQPATETPAASSRCGGAWAVTALILLLISGGGLYLFTAENPPVEDVRITQGMLFGGGVLGLIAATAAASLGRRLSRTLGVTCVLGCLMLLAVGVYAHPQRNVIIPPPPDGQDAPPSESDDTGQNGPSTTNGPREDGSSKPPVPGKPASAPKPRKRPAEAPRPAGKSPEPTKAEQPDKTSP